MGGVRTCNCLKKRARPAQRMVTTADTSGGYAVPLTPSWLA